MSSDKEKPIWSQVVEPTETDEGLAGKKGGKTYHHPAYAMIGVSRVSGGKILYGSDFQHNQFIRLTVRRSSLTRELANDWYHGGNELIEVDMSEAQWATFVSSFNIGFGVPCTLCHVKGEHTPRLPDPKSRTEQFGGEATERMERSMEALAELREAIEGLNLSVKAKKELLDKVATASRNVKPNVEFVAQQFGEYMETVVQHAKVEINAYATHAVQQVGLNALQGKMPVLTFKGGKKEGTLDDVIDVE
jgi:hypothetical protein